MPAACRVTPRDGESRLASNGVIWHVTCFVALMNDDRYVSLLLWTICVLTFACGVMAITQHPDWFGA